MQTSVNKAEIQKLRHQTDSEGRAHAQIFYDLCRFPFWSLRRSRSERDVLSAVWLSWLLEADEAKAKVSEMLDRPVIFWDNCDQVTWFILRKKKDWLGRIRYYVETEGWSGAPELCKAHAHV